MKWQRVSHRGLETRKRHTEEHPSLIKNRRISVLQRGEKAVEVKANLFTSRKTKKTAPVNTGRARRRTDSLHVFRPVQAYLI